MSGRSLADKRPFAQLEYLYTPSRDVAKDVEFFTEKLGGRLAYAIEAMGAWVAKVELTRKPPYVLLTDHLDGDRPVLVYRVDDLESAIDDLKAKGGSVAARSSSRLGPRSRSRHRAGIGSRCSSRRAPASRRGSKAAGTSRPS